MNYFKKGRPEKVIESIKLKEHLLGQHLVKKHLINYFMKVRDRNMNG